MLLTGEEIKQLAVDLEQEIQKAHKDENAYKNQCRNLITNLRNPSNKGLFRRLLNGDLPTRRAAIMSAADMSSTEYSYWAAAAEQERAEEQERLKSAFMGSSKLFSRTKVVSEADSTCDIFGLLHSDTTNEHKSHLFDLNCKICTGKQKEEDTPAPLVRRDRKVRRFPVFPSIVELSEGYVHSRKPNHVFFCFRILPYHLEPASRLLIGQSLEKS